jgi:hypothetical protein
MASQPDSTEKAAREERRAALFRETVPERIERCALGTAWALRHQGELRLEVCRDEFFRVEGQNPRHFVASQINPFP